MAAPLVLAEGLEFVYPGSDFRLALDGLRVEPGEQLAVVGPSGSGKSTLLDLLAGIRLPRRGRVVVDGVDLVRASEAERRALRARRIGFLFQDFALLEHLSVRENALVTYHLDAGLHLDDAARARVQELAAAVGIGALLDRKPRTLSGGERQRAALCRALATAPALCLADEPTGNLDPRSGAAVLDLLQQTSRERGAALVVVTHDPAAIERFDRVVELGAAAGTGGGSS